MSDCGCQHTPTTLNEKKVLKFALILNIAMFLIGLIAGIWAQSTGLLADSLDMLSDALAYAIGLYAIGRTLHFKYKAAMVSGRLLLALGVGLLIEVIWRIWQGSAPESIIMIIVACASLIVNASVLRMLIQFRDGETHLRATWIFTRADVIANFGVIISGIAIEVTKSRYPDLIIGFAIGLYVIKEALEIIRHARKSSLAI